MEEHWRAGYHDAVRTLRHPEALQRPRNQEGVATFDLAVGRAGIARNQPHRPHSTKEISYARRTVRTSAFAMPLTSPAYPIGPYRFRNREYLIITYRTDPQKLARARPGTAQVARSHW